MMISKLQLTLLEIKLTIMKLKCVTSEVVLATLKFRKIKSSRSPSNQVGQQHAICHSKEHFQGYQMRDHTLTSKQNYEQ